MVFDGSTVTTLAAVTIVQTLNALLAEKLVSRGSKPLVLGSPHFVGDSKAAENLEEYYSETKRRYNKLLSAIFKLTRSRESRQSGMVDKLHLANASYH